jgi:hypothetical protein
MGMAIALLFRGVTQQGVALQTQSTFAHTEQHECISIARELDECGAGARTISSLPQR